MSNISNNTSLDMSPGYNRSSLSCESYYYELSQAFASLLALTTSHHLANGTIDEYRHLAIEWTIEKFAAPALCLFGIVGNILNLIVLTRKSLTHSMDYMEKSAHMGLVGLAVSDMCFCVVYLIKIFIPERVLYFSRYHSVVGLYYSTYNEGLTNLFVFGSTWLTVVMAVGRYVAVCRPLHARGFINLRATRVSIVCVFVASVAANVPRFLHYHVVRITCDDMTLNTTVTRPPDDVTCPCHFYHKDVGSLYKDKAFVFYYSLGWSIAAVFVPLIILTGCNVCLIRALRQSYRMQMVHRANKPKDSGYAITPTLVALIVMFIVLVGPSGIFAFFRDHVLHPSASSGRFSAYMLAVVFVNSLVLVNFAVNFVLYCVISAQFRKIVVELACCVWLRHRKRTARFDSVYSRTSHNTATLVLSDMETEL